MNMIDPIIETRLKELDPSYRTFVNSDFAAQVAKSLGEAADLDASQILVLENATNLYLLLFLDFDDLVAFITEECHLTTEQSEKLAGAILASLPESFNEAHSLAVNQLTQNAVDNTQTANYPVQQVRTMAGDMEAVQANTETTFTSTQEALLKESAPKDPSHTPRWGSEGN